VQYEQSDAVATGVAAIATHADAATLADFRRYGSVQVRGNPG